MDKDSLFMNENKTANQPAASSSDAQTPTSSSVDTPTQPYPPQGAAFRQSQPRKSRKGLIVGGIIAGVLVLLGGGGALAYNVWYQNPDKVVHDAIINAMKAKTVQGVGTVVASGDNWNLTVALDGKSDSNAGEGVMNAKATVDIGSEAAKMSLTLDGSAMYKDETVYVKFDGIRKIFDTFAAQLPTTDQQSIRQVTAIIDKIDARWISIKASDYEDISKEVSDQQTCVSEAMKRLSQDDAAIREMTDLYKSSQFIEVAEDGTLGSRDGSLGYRVVVNQENAAAFAEGMGETTYGKALKDCDDTINFKDIATSMRDAKPSESDIKPTVELWVSRFGHEVTEFSVRAEDRDNTNNKLEVVFNPEFNTDISIEAPEDAISLKDLMADIEALVKSYSADMYGAQPQPAPVSQQYSLN